MAKTKMELEFDKEIDAILRKTRGASAVSVATAPSIHLDADIIAAFAENALPPKTRLLYTEHFANCDHCRRMLSKTILLNSETEQAFVAPVLARVIDTPTPLYKKLFQTRYLAVTMGILVLTFGGVLGFLMLQSRQAENNASVAKINESQPARIGPSLDEESGGAIANTAVLASNAPLSAANANGANPSSPIAAQDTISTNKAGTTPGRVESEPIIGSSADSSFSERDDAAKDLLKSQAGAPPPAPISVDGFSVNRDEKKLGDKTAKEEETRDMIVAKRKQPENSGAREVSPRAKNTTPTVSEPKRDQAYDYDASKTSSERVVTRSVGGKTFSNRNGVWYDSAYRNQATLNYRRDADDYKRLDSGIRKIADAIDGTVVLVWKEKAYRIQ